MPVLPLNSTASNLMADASVPHGQGGLSPTFLTVMGISAAVLLLALAAYALKRILELRERMTDTHPHPFISRFGGWPVAPWFDEFSGFEIRPLFRYAYPCVRKLFRLDRRYPDGGSMPPAGPRVMSYSHGSQSRLSASSFALPRDGQIQALPLAHTAPTRGRDFIPGGVP
ncbi:hypothetical protein JB92DRAFT_3098450 [Gautieria morchelliformis]|nr:hypothetical protein JB92DRAFT_3098450 [Gautieria morchelliformis]